jgi:hypothetical protein
MDNGTVWLTRAETRRVLETIAATCPELLQQTLEERTINLIATRMVNAQ